MSEACIDRHHELYADVAPHVVDTAPIGDGVEVGIFQSVQVILVGLVQNVVGNDIQLCHLLPFPLYVRSCREVQQHIGRCHGLRLVGLVDVRLLEVLVEPCGLH